MTMLPTSVSRSLSPTVCSSCRRKALFAAKRLSVPGGPIRKVHQNARTSSQTPGYYPSLTQASRHTYTHVSNRSLIRLSGPDVINFLNGLLPCRLQPLPKDHAPPIFTAFLNAKGRLLYDVFVYPPIEQSPDRPWYLEVDQSSAAAVFSHLKKHKLRSKFKLEKVDAQDLGVFYVWPSAQEISEIRPDIGGQDPRAEMGTRFLAPVSQPSSILDELASSAIKLSVEDYTIHRLLTGHAEGSKELISGSALPQESNIDFANGIDFHKGCYLGQELTIRTHHTGVVRKRILPCQIYSNEQLLSTGPQVPIYDPTIVIDQPSTETNLSKLRVGGGRAGRSTGKWLGGVGNIGLALCRLEMMTDIQLTAEETTYNSNDQFSITWEDGQADADGRTDVRQVRVKPFVPSWLRNNIEAGLRARTERGQKRRQEIEDEEDEDSVQ